MHRTSQRGNGGEVCLHGIRAEQMLAGCFQKLVDAGFTHVVFLARHLQMIHVLHSIGEGPLRLLRERGSAVTELDGL